MTVNRRRMPENRENKSSSAKLGSFGKCPLVESEVVPCKKMVSSDSAEQASIRNTETKAMFGQQVTADSSTANAYRAVEADDDIFADDSAPCLPTVGSTKKDCKQRLQTTVKGRQVKEMTVATVMAKSVHTTCAQDRPSSPDRMSEKMESDSTAPASNCAAGTTMASSPNSHILSTSTDTVNSGTNLKKEHCSRADDWLRCRDDSKPLTFCKQELSWGSACWIAPTLRIYLTNWIALCLALETHPRKTWNKQLLPILDLPTLKWFAFRTVPVQDTHGFESISYCSNRCFSMCRMSKRLCVHQWSLILHLVVL